MTPSILYTQKEIINLLPEALRMYPPGVTISRTCTKNYTVPGSDVVIEVGTNVHVPVYALHHDPQYFPQPEKFDPERFNEEESKRRPNYTYLPFGDGPRQCIGNVYSRL